MNDLPYWVAFTRIRGIGPVRFRRLKEVFGSAHAAWEAPEKELGEVLGDRLAAVLSRERRKIDPERVLSDLHQRGIDILINGSGHFPTLLNIIPQPPCLLYVKGDLSCLNTYLPLAVVGTRRPTPYGRKIAFDFCRILAEKEMVVVSGMASGIDGEAHRGALASGGKTVAVLGTGINVVYPAAHVRLAEAIVKGGGAIVSEYPPDTGPRRENFPVRNRLISGMSRGVLVVEAPMRSGALITADFALEQGREVMAVPGPVTSRQSEGTNRLIAQGALCVLNVEDVRAALGRPEQAFLARAEPAEGIELSPEEMNILSRIEYTGTSKGELLEKSGLGGGTFFRILIELELQGLIREEPGGVLYKR
ncbi:MAG TPA: DNA-processing protein DprA [Atribacteraceae bacterium]|nr:DNA-processing protein DprA [Atribacteraceae bacterium]